MIIPVQTAPNAADLVKLLPVTANAQMTKMKHKSFKKKEREKILIFFFFLLLFVIELFPFQLFMKFILAIKYLQSSP